MVQKQETVKNGFKLVTMKVTDCPYKGDYLQLFLTSNSASAHAEITLKDGDAFVPPISYPRKRGNVSFGATVFHKDFADLEEQLKVNHAMEEIIKETFIALEI